MAKTEVSEQSEPLTRVTMAEYDALWRKVRDLTSKNLELEEKVKRRAIKEARKAQLEPEAVHTEPSTAESAPVSERPHVAYSFMKDCPECGGSNPNYKPANVFCDGPECKGVIPLGSIDAEKDIRKEKDGKAFIDNIKECWNCGATGDSLHVIVKEGKKAA